MRKQGYDEETIGLAVGTSVSVSEEVLAARGVFKELLEKYKEQVRPEYEQVVQAGDCISSAPSATKAAGSTISCAAVREDRETRANPPSSCPCRMI